MKYVIAVQSRVFYPETEIRWQRYDELRRAEREFRRSRRLAIARLLRDRLALSPSSVSAAPSAPSEGVFELALEGIAGFVDTAGRLRRGLPPMPRSLMRAWKAARARDDSDLEEDVFALRFAEGLWYLEGGGKALLRLELLRMKGLSTVHAKVAPLAALRELIDPIREECRDEGFGRIAC